MYIVSACLAGMSCRYDGETNTCPYVMELLRTGNAIPVCPEQLGGLTTPRPAAEIREGRVITKTGEDLTDTFNGGAQEGLKLARNSGCKHAILKAKSPSCGCGKIYDGTFSREFIEGNGIFAQLLLDNGINVTTEKDYEGVRF